MAGIDLIRRRSGGVAHGLTWPLLTRADGQKFGKTAEGTIWLDGARTLPFDLHQYLLRTDDADVERLLAQLTLLPMSDVREVAAEHRPVPERRLAQQHLADEVTRFVHGDGAVATANLAAEALYGKAPLSGEMLGALGGIVSETRVGIDSLADPEALVGLLVASGLCTSRGDARRQLRQSAISVNRGTCRARRCGAGVADRRAIPAAAARPAGAPPGRRRGLAVRHRCGRAGMVAVRAARG